MLKRDLIEYPFAWVYIGVGLISPLLSSSPSSLPAPMLLRSTDVKDTRGCTHELLLLTMMGRIICQTTKIGTRLLPHLVNTFRPNQDYTPAATRPTSNSSQYI